ncbi:MULTISPECIES: DUF2179 domain-containing protein [Dysgonomonas]|uniref:DUF2179 domain-containing protein n=1 Tax=Dysgonomonas TaxID=156973 RepID=UPI00092C70FF|nr:MULTISPECIES: DUF5698 domain-containing protein [Dysgonomonas]MBN9301335.1 DUF2179 domain-containing protein [Dysgonomonas mossii]OJX60157.1 MAG: hypothetical protein BGO84_06460 [Dysgonomonas sp. 37-18]
MFTIFETYPWLLPVMIFFGRICDVTLGTLRIIFVSKGEKYKAPIVGFFEVFIWVVIISQIFSQANSLVAYVAYAAGYAAGNYVGILVENRIAFGYQLLRVYTKKEALELIKMLNSKDIGATFVKGEGAVSQVHIVEIVIGRKSLNEVIGIISDFDSKVFYLVEDIRYKKEGIFTLKNFARK